MEITEVRIKLIADADDRLQAFCSITFDQQFVVRDIKIIDGAHGPFVAMPSRKIAVRCAKCGNKNPIRARYCNQCGSRTHPQEGSTRSKSHADIAHPINSECREQISACVIAAYEEEVRRAQLPGYRSTYDDGYQEGQAPRESKTPDRHTIHSQQIAKAIHPRRPSASDTRSSKPSD